ncbi:hypothetical protein [Giesbergeria anulus]|uniref:DUF3102 domain-containing protein n=1 Tax=Giesbergeria anulus TaxID=180197 RepID=A0A1H9JEH9_9BURK|nr:hypothetical protein [Giesbergeria anulus]SEQ85242.1 hypothetical protein SAMN02982919_01375 [Giesbergeria anulus]
MARHTPTPQVAVVDDRTIDLPLNATNPVDKLAILTMDASTKAKEVAHHMGYQGAMTVGALEDEIRFYQKRTVEAILETGKRLLILKELTPHGEFTQRVEMLGFAKTTAFRFMQAAAKTIKSSKLELLSTQVKSASAFLELVTHDDDVLESVAELDDIDRLSASQLRAKVRELSGEKEAVEKLMVNKNTKIDQLEREKQLIQKLPPDEALEKTMKEATAITRDALGAIRGGLRQALQALNDAPDGTGKTVFMAGLVGQVQADLNALREEFNLPDVSTAADAALAAEVAQWSK